MGFRFGGRLFTRQHDWCQFCFRFSAIPNSARQRNKALVAIAQGAMNPTGLQRSNGVAMLQSLLRQPLHPVGSRRSTQHVAVARRMRKLSVDVRFRQLTQIKG